MELHRETRARATRRRTAAPSMSRRSTCSADRGRDRRHRAGDGPAARLGRGEADRPDRRGRSSPDLRGRAARRAAERVDADLDGGQAPLHRAPRRRGPARDRGDVVRFPTGHPATGRCRRAPGRAPATGRCPLPGTRAQRARPGPRRGGRGGCDRRLHRGDRRLHEPQHRDDGRRSRSRPSRRFSRGPASSGGGGARTCRPRSGARTRVGWSRRPRSKSRGGSRISASRRSASATRSASACRTRSASS